MGITSGVYSYDTAVLSTPVIYPSTPLMTIHHVETSSEPCVFHIYLLILHTNRELFALAE
jgi:hypothetical protein